jgi:hypothetical protein
MENATDSDANSPGGLSGLFLRLWEFWESAERILSVLAGLVLAGLFCLMPFSTLGAEEPWYFWVGSGLIALAASVLLALVFFPPKRKRMSRTTGEEPDPGGHQLLRL